MLTSTYNWCLWGTGNANSNDRENVMRYGSPDIQQSDVAIVKRFWGRVDRNGPIMPGMKTRCWIWMLVDGSKVTSYGTFSFKKHGRTSIHRAPRVAWVIAHGPIPDGMMTCHKCDNPACVRPGHLFLGTGTDNYNDMVKKGRQRFYGNSILTKKEVRKIRRLKARHPKMTYRELGEMFDVSLDAIAAVVTRSSWRNIE